MTREHRQSDQNSFQAPAKTERTREETEALLAEVRHNREERMDGRRNLTDSVKAVRQMREGRVHSRVGKR